MKVSLIRKLWKQKGDKDLKTKDKDINIDSETKDEGFKRPLWKWDWRK